jgi:ribosomal protein L36
MASKLFPLSRNLLTLIFSCGQQTTRHLLQLHSSLTTASRTLSSIPLSTLPGSTSSNTKPEPSTHVCSLMNCGNQGTVLVSIFKVNALQARSYKSMKRLELTCEGCYFAWRHGRKYVECSDHPSHKQMAKIATRYVWQEDYSKGNVTKAMDWSKRFKREEARLADREVLSHNWLAGKLGKEI